MINVSSQLKKESHSRCYVTAKCVLSDGTTLNLEKEDFYNSGNGIVDSSDSSDFPLGAAIEKTATMTLVNDKGKFSTYNFNKARFTIFLNVQLSTGIETIKRGTFVVNKKPATAEKINLTLVDHMSLADKAYSTNLVFPCSVGEVLRDSCQTCGIAVGDASFPNDDFQVAEAPANTTHRAVIGFCAMLAGGNARIDENDKLRIVSFNRNVSVMSSFTDGGTFSPWTEGDSVDGGTFSPWTEGDTVDGGVFGDRDDVHILNAIQDVQFDVDDVTVTGIKTTVDDLDYLYGQEGYVLNIENPLINGNIENGLQRIGEIVVGISMRPFSLKSVANAYITFLDPVVFSDTKGHLFFSYATDVDFSFGGYTSIANTVKSLEENETEFYSGNGVVVEQAKKEIEKKLSAYDIAVRNMNQLSANTLGFYYTQVQNDDGSIIAYRHDKPNLADSKVVYKSGVDGFFVTADYQGTDDATTAAGKWASGFDSNGDAVLNILYAIGINADWINSGTINADLIKSGTINADLIKSGTLKADLVKGGTLEGVKIIGESGKIGGFTMTSTKLYAGNAEVSDEVVVEGEGIVGGIVGIQAPTDSNLYAFFAGADSTKSFSSAPFRVTKYGKLYASNAVISGKVRNVSGNTFVELDDGTLKAGNISNGKSTTYCKLDCYAEYSGGVSNTSLIAVTGNLVLGAKGSTYFTDTKLNQWAYIDSDGIHDMKGISVSGTVIVPATIRSDGTIESYYTAKLVDGILKY